MKRHSGRGLGVECRTLAHPEAVLLVDHAERELAKLHRRLDQRVRAHDELQLPRRQPAEDLAAARRGRGPGEQGDRDRAPDRSTAFDGEFLKCVNCRFPDTARRRVDNAKHVHRVMRIQ